MKKPAIFTLVLSVLLLSAMLSGGATPVQENEVIFLDDILQSADAIILTSVQPTDQHPAPWILELKKGDEYFDEVVVILSRYGFTLRKWSLFSGSGAEFNSDEPHRSFIATISGPEDMHSFTLTENGSISFDGEDYDMTQGMGEVFVSDIFKLAERYGV
ncbi:MAG: hypothetical protein R3Y07_00965 [Eubacteriales bacterium]